MTSLEAALRKIGTELTQAGVPFALVGGLAVSVRTEPRFTRDADLVVALAGDAEAEALIHNLRAQGYGIEAVIEQEAVGRLATVRLTPSREPQAPVVDLLFASSGIEAEVVAEAEPIDLLPQLRMAGARDVLPSRYSTFTTAKPIAMKGSGYKTAPSLVPATQPPPWIMTTTGVGVLASRGR